MAKAPIKSTQGDGTFALVLGGKSYTVPRLNLGQIEDLLCDVVTPEPVDDPAAKQRYLMRRMRYVVATALCGSQQFAKAKAEELTDELRGWQMSRAELMAANDKILIDAGLAFAPGEAKAPGAKTTTQAPPAAQP